MADEPNGGWSGPPPVILGVLDSLERSPSRQARVPLMAGIRPQIAWNHLSGGHRRLLGPSVIRSSHPPRLSSRVALGSLTQQKATAFGCSPARRGNDVYSQARRIAFMQHSNTTSYARSGLRTLGAWLHSVPALVALRGTDTHLLRLSTGPSPSRPAKFSVFATAAIVWIFWLIGMNAGDRWGLFGENWFMSITMTLGSFIAGATSEGGGAVAFPVMTMMFKIPPHVARDFSLMIQAVGMTAAAVTILYTRIPIERRALCWASIGGALGVIIGIELISPYLPARETKVTFLAIWLAFSFALYWINRAPEREVRTEIESFGPRHSLLLAGTGIIGGAISGTTGSGLDILIFSLLVLRFRISEKVATPTSVILMAINAVVGFLWKANVGGGMSEDAWNYWWVCLPIVVIGAPAGARFIRNRSRLFVARILYVSIIAQFIAGLLIIPQTAGLIGYTAGIFACAMLLFRGMAKGGDKRLSWLNQPGRAG